MIIYVCPSVEHVTYALCENSAIDRTQTDSGGSGEGVNSPASSPAFIGLISTGFFYQLRVTKVDRSFVLRGKADANSSKIRHRLTSKNESITKAPSA